MTGACMLRRWRGTVSKLVRRLEARIAGGTCVSAVAIFGVGSKGEAQVLDGAEIRLPFFVAVVDCFFVRVFLDMKHISFVLTATMRGSL